MDDERREREHHARQPGRMLNKLPTHIVSALPWVWTALVKAPHLVPAQERVEDEARVGHLLRRERVRLRDAARIGRSRLANVRRVHVVAAAVGAAVRVARADVCRRRVREVVVDFGLSQ